MRLGFGDEPPACKSSIVCPACEQKKALAAVAAMPETKSWCGCVDWVVDYFSRCHTILRKSLLLEKRILAAGTDSMNSLSPSILK
jgi:hypothetical protein